MALAKLDKKSFPQGAHTAMLSLVILGTGGFRSHLGAVARASLDDPKLRAGFHGFQYHHLAGWKCRR